MTIRPPRRLATVLAAAAAPAALDPSFGRNGIAAVEHPVTDVAVSGMRTYAGTVYFESPDPYQDPADASRTDEAAVVALDAAGKPDAGFGDGGTVALPVPAGMRPTEVKLSVDGQGRVLVTLRHVRLDGSPDGRPAGYELVRLMPDGTVDPTWGEPGNALRHSPNDVNPALWGLGRALPDGTVLVQEQGNQGEQRVVRYLGDGTLDTSFGTGGTLVVYSEDGQFWDVSVEPLPGGGLVVNRAGSSLVQYTARGQLDTSFGTGGSTPLTVSGGSWGLWRLSSGRLLVYTKGSGSGEHAYSPALYAFTAAGQLARRSEMAAASSCSATATRSRSRA